MTTRHLPVGTQVGRSLSRLVERSAREHVRPESIGVKQDVARQTAALIHEIVRSGFSQAAESRTYEALAVVEEWFTRREWRTLCESESSVDIARVGEDIGEALLLLARLGLTDDRLRLSLQTACGSHSRADTICRRMATTIPGISRDVRDWLIGARRRVHSEHAEESQVRSVDQVLAELLIDRNRLAHASEVVKTELLPDVSTVLPTVRRCVDSTDPNGGRHGKQAGTREDVETIAHPESGSGAGSGIFATRAPIPGGRGAWTPCSANQPDR